MTPSEFTFLALGLVLGVASGAALLEVLRARPPSAREIRVTVAPNAIHSRLAATLAEPHGAGDASGPARGGPGDRRGRDEIAATGEPAATGRRVNDRSGLTRGAMRPGFSGTSVRTTTAIDDRGPGAGGDALVRPGSSTRTAQSAAVARPAPSPAQARPAPLWLNPAGAGAGLVAVPMSLEPDPITTALRASAGASAVAAMPAMTLMASARTTDRAEPARSAVATMPAQPPRPTETTSAATGDLGDDRTIGSDRADPVAGSGDPAAGSAAAPSGAPSSPCAEERRIADERCAVATRARAGATEAAESLRRAQREYDELVARAESGAATTDPRSIRSAKEQAQQQFRDARGRAGTRDDVEAAARAWLAEINRINQQTREAAVGVERDRAAATALGPNLERLAVETDAARITAERADEACVAAREAVAVCDEARTLEDAAARARQAERDVAEPAPAEGEPGATDHGDQDDDRIAATSPLADDDLSLSTPMNSRAGQDALILRILRGDREAMQRAVARLAGNDGEAHRRWQAHLGALAEALIARSIEATAFDFPLEHPFWGPFNQGQNRDIAAGLSSLGFRFDGFGGWVDERQPSQRDLSLAVGYAGLDPMRVRRWPNEAETRDLLRNVRVAADEYVAGAAGGLTLGELVTLLGRRADGLTELWNQWGSVRPILLEAN